MEGLFSRGKLDDNYVTACSKRQSHEHLAQFRSRMDVDDFQGTEDRWLHVGSTQVLQYGGSFLGEGEKQWQNLSPGTSKSEAV